jgi:D-glycero-D-manno-heptose 1,7-bisphosphate phosphatase
MTLAPLEEHQEHQPAVFLDRDGTIMREVEYCSDPKAIEIFDGVTEALRGLKNAGYKLFVITNQSGIGRGYFDEQQYRVVERELGRQLGEDLLTATYYCPDKPDTASRRRKPSPEMVYEAARDYQLDLARSFFVGDKAIDIECGRNAGLRTILVQTGYGARERNCAPDWIAQNLVEAAKIVLGYGG